MSQLTPEQEVTRGHDAQRILNEPLLQEAFQTVEAKIVSALTSSAMGDDKTHNRLVIALQMLNQIKGQIHEYVQTGEMAQLQLEQSALGKLKRAVGF